MSCRQLDFTSPLVFLTIDTAQKLSELLRSSTKATAIVDLDLTTMMVHRHALQLLFNFSHDL